jgi:hypothetical protein
LLHDDPAWAKRAEAFSALVRDSNEFLAERVKANPPSCTRLCEYRTILAGRSQGAGGELKFCDTRAISPNQRS